MVTEGRAPHDSLAERGDPAGLRDLADRSLLNGDGGDDQPGLRHPPRNARRLRLKDPEPPVPVEQTSETLPRDHDPSRDARRRRRADPPPRRLPRRPGRPGPRPAPARRAPAAGRDPGDPALGRGDQQRLLPARRNVRQRQPVPAPARPAAREHEASPVAAAVLDHCEDVYFRAVEQGKQPLQFSQEVSASCSPTDPITTIEPESFFRGR